MTDFTQTEKARLDVQSSLDSRKSAKERNKLGQFATPSALALNIAEYVSILWGRRQQKVSFIDPAIGTGSFYSAMLQVFGASRVERQMGVELDVQFAAAAASLWKSTGLKVIQRDFTKLTPPPLAKRFNLLLTNPPYVRHHHLTMQDKHRLKNQVKATLGITPSGLSGLYCYFLLLAHEWLKENGIGVWLIPSEFMSVNYGSAIREYLSRKVSLLHIHRFCPEDVQFSDALVSSAIAVYRKTTPKLGHRVKFSFGGFITKPDTEQVVDNEILQTSSRWLSYPTGTNRSNNATHPLTLGDLFAINRGIATGSNNFFILSREKAQRLCIPDRWLRPILPSPRHVNAAIIESDDEGYPVGCRQLCVIDCDAGEGEVRRIAPEFWDYLQSGIDKRIHAGYLTSRRTPWYSQEVRPPAPFVCTYMGRTSVEGRKPFRLIWNKCQATVANVYLALYPKGPLKQLLDSQPQAASEVFAALQQITEAAFTDESRVYGGGLYKLEPKELARVSAGSLRQLFNPARIKRQTMLAY
jgi:hypothetical protein